MAITLPTASGPVTLKECDDGYEKGIGPGGPWLNKTYFINDYTKANNVADALLGLAYGVGGIAGTIIRQAPHRCPEVQSLFAAAVGPIRGFGAATPNGGSPLFPGGALIPVSYAVPTFQLGGSLNEMDPYNLQNFDDQIYPYCSQSVDFDVESYTTETAWKYAEGANAGKYITGTNVTVDVATALMVVTVHRVPFLPIGTLLPLMKRTNNATFLGRSAGTILFDKFRTQKEKNTDGSFTQDITLHFKYREHGHNYIPDQTNPTTWVRFSNDGTLTGTFAYPPADLRATIFGVDLS